MHFEYSNRQDRIESDTRANKRSQPTAFGAGMRGVSCQSRRRLNRRPLGGYDDVVSCGSTACGGWALRLEIGQ